MTIEAEQLTDFAAVREVISDAFGRTDEADLVERLRALPDFNPHLSLVARVGKRVVGHVLFSPVEIISPTKLTKALALAPLSVAPSFQCQGIGSGLVLHGLGACKLAGHGLVVVLGEPGYYSRFGFESASAFGIQAPFEVPPEAYRVAEIASGALSGVTGTVRYSKPFHDL